MDIIERLLQGNQETGEAQKSYYEVLKKAKENMDVIFEDCKSQADEERVVFLDSARQDVDAHFAARAEFISSVFKAKADELSLVGSAYIKVEMDKDSRAIEFVTDLHKKQLAKLKKDEDLFRSDLEHYIAQMEKIFRRIVR